MIESITLSSVATYGNVPAKLTGLSKFNFLYGANGAGKTTISRVIADPDAYPGCSVSWLRGTKLEALVYNRDFVAQNFSPSSTLKGIFTLGEKNIETLEQIASAKKDLDDLNERIAKLKATLDGESGQVGKRAELQHLEENFRAKCWAQKQKHDRRLAGAFEGFRNSAERFKEKVLKECSENSATVDPIEKLEERASAVFGQTPVKEEKISLLKFEDFVLFEASPLLSKRIIGRSDVDIAAMIQKLGNSDWVRAGRHYHEVNENHCPFCQQATSEKLSQSLAEFFDDAYEKDLTAIGDLRQSYGDRVASAKEWIAGISVAPSKFLDLLSIKLEVAKLDNIFQSNIQLLSQKAAEPSLVVTLESTAPAFAAVEELISEANKQINAHNLVVTNLVAERQALTSKVWKYVIDAELRADIDSYSSAKKGISKAIEGLESQIEKRSGERTEKIAQIRDLERTTTSIQPTVDGINALLVSFGFRGFSLSKSDDGLAYRLIRPNGNDAKETLSEGERTFITFLYFYFLLKGSASEVGITSDRVVVFDDPVSSLDSDILFIVSSLIKGLFEEVRSTRGLIKQVFVLTHNVYFHKEVTFNPDRRGQAMNEETFWIVRKTSAETEINRHESNPVKTSYELLWGELRRPDKSQLTIQNTMRRIVENYFKILGGVDPDKICGLFSGKEKLICKSLFSWINDGSHFAHDDLYVSMDPMQVDVYLEVFKEIFERSGNIAHYNMMMGDDARRLVEVAPANADSVGGVAA